MVRVGPVHYNTEEEIRRFGEALGKLAAVVSGQEGEMETRMKPEIEYTIHIAGKAKEVYEVITTPRKASKVFPGLMKSFGKVGEPVVWEWQGKEFANGKVVELSEDCNTLKHTFKFVGEEAGIDPTKEVHVTWTYLIKEENGLSVLNVQVTGFAPKSQMKKTLSWGVPYIMSGVKSVVETGKSIAEIAAEKAKTGESANK